MARTRWDETWHRLREWTDASGQAERLAAQLLIREGFENVDPSHPLGGKDGGRDIECTRSRKSVIAAVFFPRGQSRFSDIKRKFQDDLKSARQRCPHGFVFITNQELRLAERESLRELNESETIDIYHLERITALLDDPQMASVRSQFLGIGEDAPSTVLNLGGQGGQAPGAGGGGGGAIGRGAIAGDGGEGGQVVTAWFRAEDLPNSVEISVGRGGKEGERGEDTMFGGFLRASGGRPGTSGQQKKEDWSSRLVVVGFYFADTFNLREGLLNILGAGWERVSVDNLNAPVDLLTVSSVDLGSLPDGAVVEISIAVQAPTGVRAIAHQFSLQADGRRISLRHIPALLHFEITEPGLWRVQLIVGESVLADRPIEMVLKNSGDDNL